MKDQIKLFTIFAMGVFLLFSVNAEKSADLSEVNNSGENETSRKEKPDVRFGVVSDIHLLRPNHDKLLEKAFVYFRDRGVDAIMIPGDIADNGRISELKRCADIWKRVFPGDRGMDGRRVEKLFIYGNHDIWGSYHMIKQNPKLAREDAIAFEEGRPKRVWQEVFGEPYSDFWLKEVIRICVYRSALD